MKDRRELFSGISNHLRQTAEQLRIALLELEKQKALTAKWKKTAESRVNKSVQRNLEQKIKDLKNAINKKEQSLIEVELENGRLIKELNKVRAVGRVMSL